MGPAELDGGVRPQVHLQVHLLGLDHLPAGRGNAEGSASDKWMGNILQMRKEAVPFLESLGIPKPRSKAEWSYIFKEMGTFLAAKNFIVNFTTARRRCVSGRSVTSESPFRCHR